MSTIVTRAGKGSALTHNEVDANFTNLNTDKLQSGNTAAALTITSATIAGGTINGTTVGATTPAAGTFTDLTANNSAVISVNTSGDALRITQTGSGNALVVEDAANPDSTPFVIDASGVVVSGNTTPITAVFGARIQTQLTDATAGFSSIRFSADGGSVQTVYAKSRGAIGVNSAVVSGDELGTLNFAGADGTNYLRAASIFAAVDGTPGTNDMPGRLVFSTTADGASSPTERMRIDNSGAVGIGATSLTGYVLRLGRNIFGATTSYGILNQGTIQPTVTGSGIMQATSVLTAANGGTPYTIASILHYQASQGTFNADSTVTNQYGFTVASNLIGATNNYGFHSAIASGTGRYNFYAAGTADNYFAGNVLINRTAGVGSEKLSVNGSLAIIGDVSGNGSIGSGSAAGRFIYAGGATGGVSDSGAVITRGSSAGTNAFGVEFWTNNTERLRINSSGNVGIGTTNPTARLNIVDATTQDALRITQTGTGNALVIEDDTNPDSTPFVVDASGQLIRGYTSALATVTQTGTATTPALQTAANAQAGASVGLFNYSAAVSGSYITLSKSKSGTVGSVGAVASGDTLGSIVFAGDDGTAFLSSAFISAAVDGTPGTNDMPGRLVFGTTADGASSPTERMRIGSDGLVQLASTSGLSIGRTAVTSPAATDGNVFSGTYTPTLTNTTNIAASTAYECYYIRVGNMVNVSGRVGIDPTAAGSITLGVSLPISSDITNNCYGTCNNQQGDAIAITADNTNNRASFVGTIADTANRQYSFTFQYQVV